MIEITLSIIGGLVLFLFAVSSLSDVIKKIAGENSKRWILRFTSNTWTAILTGTVVTAILDSSSAVIILTIILVNSKMLSFRRSMGIVMGANIGTTVSSQIIAMDIGKYSPVFLLIGLIMFMISRNERVSDSGRILLYFGMLFFGLFTMERAVEPLKHQAFFYEWMKELDKPLSGALTGAIVTLVIQSSSATVGMAIVLAKKGAISLAGGIAVMLGAELGTCSDTLLATIKGSRQAIKTGLFHLFFNFVSIVLGLVFFIPFILAVEYVSHGASLERSLANAHMLFNFMGVLLFVGFVPVIEKMLNKLLPEKSVSFDYESVSESGLPIS